MFLDLSRDIDFVSIRWEFHLSALLLLAIFLSETSLTLNRLQICQEIRYIYNRLTICIRKVVSICKIKGYDKTFHRLFIIFQLFPSHVSITEVWSQYIYKRYVPATSSHRKTILSLLSHRRQPHQFVGLQGCVQSAKWNVILLAALRVRMFVYCNGSYTIRGYRE